MTDKTLLYELPVIRRARDYHVYDFKGRRYLDFYLEGGKALLGHRPERLSVEIKNILGKGLLAAYPGAYAERLRKALLLLLPDYRDVSVFADWADALAFLSEKPGRQIGKADIAEPVFGEKGEISIWRPFLDADYPDTVIPCIPLPGLTGPVVIARKTIKEKFSIAPVSALVAGAMCRIVHNLIEAIRNDPWKNRQFKVAGWKRAGPYLRFSGTEKEYKAVYERGLSAGVLFAPGFPSFSILPAEYDEGELRAFYKGEADA